MIEHLAQGPKHPGPKELEAEVSTILENVRADGTETAWFVLRQLDARAKGQTAEENAELAGTDDVYAGYRSEDFTSLINLLHQNAEFSKYLAGNGPD